MVIRVTQNQLYGVSLILSRMIEAYSPENMEEKLVLGLVLKAYKKISKKTLTQLTPRSGWSFNLTDEEAMALHVFLEHAEIPDVLYQYEAIQIRSISDKIHQQYG